MLITQKIIITFPNRIEVKNRLPGLCIFNLILIIKILNTPTAVVMSQMHNVVSI